MPISGGASSKCPSGFSALHVGGAFSCLEILDAIYFGLMTHERPDDSDTCLLSKGHGSVALYVVLERLGVLTRADLDGYCKPGGRQPTFWACSSAISSRSARTSSAQKEASGCSVACRHSRGTTSFQPVATRRRRVLHPSSTNRAQ